MGDDIDTQSESDLLKSANDAVRRALVDASIGESTGKLIAYGAGAFAVAAVVGFVAAAAVIKVTR